ncbi:uncharacterized protein K452DRAFT_311103 [Aplosporella prunicola CBS 121167]|uniref:Uncharacterized protein n=1 Tax=Aplosporella prunicola CBS 121167 TaxID=1176127 RepID=A0A6A6B7I9_9PEZI|nr:uncharacterized protein K452DRAFT_311103 [Aplosporella prunicola CBS 121167]KAF2139174.1 hypothetical protein K452DRAFT_311103 [Aplosporella prunicola CBS 121167]
MYLTLWILACLGGKCDGGFLAGLLACLFAAWLAWLAERDGDEDDADADCGRRPPTTDAGAGAGGCVSVGVRAFWRLAADALVVLMLLTAGDSDGCGGVVLCGGLVEACRMACRAGGGGLERMYATGTQCEWEEEMGWIGTGSRAE